MNVGVSSAASINNWASFRKKFYLTAHAAYLHCLLPTNIRHFPQLKFHSHCMLHHLGNKQENVIFLIQFCAHASAEFGMAYYHMTLTIYVLS